MSVDGPNPPLPQYPRETDDSPRYPVGSETGPNTPRRRAGPALSIIALAVALISALLIALPALTPLRILITSPLEIAGVVIAIVALALRVRWRAMAISGLVLSALSFVVGITLVGVNLVVGFSSAATTDSEAPVRGQTTAVVEAISDAPTVDVTFTTSQRNVPAAVIRQQSAAAEPFTGTMIVDLSTPVFHGFAVAAGPGGTTATCRITADGLVLDEKTVNGAGAVAICVASAAGSPGVVFEATGTARDAAITYGGRGLEAFFSGTSEDTDLPYRHEELVYDIDRGAYTMTATIESGGGDVTCRITYVGVPLAAGAASGTGGTATCEVARMK